MANLQTAPSAFYKGCANGLLVHLREWVAGQASPAPASVRGGSGYGYVQRRGQDNPSPRNNARMSVNPPDLPGLSLSFSKSAKGDRMRYLLKLIEDEEYMVMNGRVVDTSMSTSTQNTSKTGHNQNQNQNQNQANATGNGRLAENPPISFVGLSPKKKRRFSVDYDHDLGDDDLEDPDELFHTAPNSPVKALPFVPVRQSPLGKNGDGAFRSSSKGSASFQSPVRRAISFTSPAKGRRPASFVSPVKSQGAFQSPVRANVVQSPLGNQGGFRVTSERTGESHLAY